MERSKLNHQHGVTFQVTLAYTTPAAGRRLYLTSVPAGVERQAQSCVLRRSIRRIVKARAPASGQTAPAGFEVSHSSRNRKNPSLPFSNALCALRPTQHGTGRRSAPPARSARRRTDVSSPPTLSNILLCLQHLGASRHYLLVISGLRFHLSLRGITRTVDFSTVCDLAVIFTLETR